MTQTRGGRYSPFVFRRQIHRLRDREERLTVDARIPAQKHGNETMCHVMRGGLRRNAEMRSLSRDKDTCTSCVLLRSIALVQVVCNVCVRCIVHSLALVEGVDLDVEGVCVRCAAHSLALRCV